MADHKGWLLDLYEDERDGLVLWFATESGERLLRIVIDHLQRFKSLGPVMVSVQPPPQPDRSGLVDIVASAADQVYARDIPVEPVNLTLF